LILFEIHMICFMTQFKIGSASSRINILSLFTLKPAIVNISLNLFEFYQNIDSAEILSYSISLYHALRKRS
jgi:hypothetical protein